MLTIDINDMPAAVRAAIDHGMSSVTRRTPVSSNIEVEMPAAQEIATAAGTPIPGAYTCVKYSAERSPMLQPTRQRVVFSEARRQVSAHDQKPGAAVAVLLQPDDVDLAWVAMAGALPQVLVAALLQLDDAKRIHEARVASMLLGITP